MTGGECDISLRYDTIQGSDIDLLGPGIAAACHTYT